MEVDKEKGRRFVVLDFYRFVAALGVFIFHLKNIDSGISPSWSGSYGLFVDMFFILSGFVIAYSYPSNPIRFQSYCRFMVRRVARIYPLHVLTLFIFVIIGWLGFSDSTSIGNLSDFVYNLFLIQAWGVTDHLSFNTPAWSISAELFCYILFPVLMFIATRIPPLALAAIVAITYAVLAHAGLPIWAERSQMYGANFDFAMLRALPSFLNGILLVMLFKSLMANRVRKKATVVAGMLLFALAILILNVFAKPDLAIILFSLAILFTAIGESAFEKIPGSYWLGRLGNTSYAIYMLHRLLIILLFKPLWVYLGISPAAFGVFALACCVVLTMVADLTYTYIENPSRIFINWLASAQHLRFARKEVLQPAQPGE